MNVSRDQYAVWQQQHSELNGKVHDDQVDWVGQIASFASAVERDSPDPNVKTHARHSREYAVSFRDAKNSQKERRSYEQFLGSWYRLSIAIGMHLIDHSRSN